MRTATKTKATTRRATEARLWLGAASVAWAALVGGCNDAEARRIVAMVEATMFMVPSICLTLAGLVTTTVMSDRVKRSPRPPIGAVVVSGLGAGLAIVSLIVVLIILDDARIGFPLSTLVWPILNVVGAGIILLKALVDRKTGQRLPAGVSDAFGPPAGGPPPGYGYGPPPGAYGPPPGYGYGPPPGGGPPPRDLHDPYRPR